jgi:hypothetical protein
MKLFLSLVAVDVGAAVLAPTATASDAKTGLRRNLDSTFAPSTNEGSKAICLPGGDEPLSKSKAALLQSLVSLVVNSNNNKKPGLGGITDAERSDRPRRDPPKYLYVFGCGFLDFDCYECELCQDAYGLLIETGSKAACDAACVATVEAAGGGPEDRTCCSFVRRVRVEPVLFAQPSHLTFCHRIRAFFCFDSRGGCGRRRMRPPLRGHIFRRRCNDRALHVLLGRSVLSELSLRTSSLSLRAATVPNQEPVTLGFHLVCC